MVEIEIVEINTPEDCNLILGQSHFIKTAEDLYEAIVNTVPQSKFGLSFGEASGDCLVRIEGNDEKLKKSAGEEMLKLACGHAFLIFIKDAFPLNITQRIKNVPEVVNIFCATANPVQTIIVESDQGRGIIGVIDGFEPGKIETEKDVKWRRQFLKDMGYKL